MANAMERTSAKYKILNAALNVIREKGYTATTVDDLCEKAGVTKGAFFHHFKSKEDMAVIAAEYWSAITNDFFASAPYQKISDPLDRLLGYVQFRKSIMRGELAEFTCFVGTMVQEVHDSSPAIRDACSRSIFGHAANLARDIAQAKAHYAPEADWKPESLAAHIQAVIQGAFILAKAKNDPEIAEDSLEHLHHYIEFLFQNNKRRNK